MPILPPKLRARLMSAEALLVFPGGTSRKAIWLIGRNRNGSDADCNRRSHMSVWKETPRYSRVMSSRLSPPMTKPIPASTRRSTLLIERPTSGSSAIVMRPPGESTIPASTAR